MWIIFTSIARQHDGTTFSIVSRNGFFLKKKIEGHNLVLNVRRVDFRVKWGRNMGNAFVTLHEQFDRRICKPDGLTLRTQSIDTKKK